jgi:hypothetical protein
MGTIHRPFIDIHRPILTAETFAWPGKPAKTTAWRSEA